MPTITKHQLARQLSEELDLPYTQTLQIATALFEAMKQAVLDGNRIEVRGFGSWEVRETAPKKGRNPMTGGSVDVPARKRVRFKASEGLRRRINSYREAK